MKNRFKVITLLIILGFMLQGCTTQNSDTPVANDTDTETVEQKEDDSSSEQDSSLENEDEVVQTDVKRVGEINYGFVNIPSQWVMFDDISVSEPIIQYSDPTGIAIITLNVWKDPNNNAEAAATAAWAKMEEDGAQDVQGATVELGDSNAFQVYGFYPTEQKMLVTWFFETDDGYIHYVSAESSEEDIVEVVERVEKSFSLEK